MSAWYPALCSAYPKRRAFQVFRSPSAIQDDKTWIVFLNSIQRSACILTGRIY